MREVSKDPKVSLNSLDNPRQYPRAEVYLDCVGPQGSVRPSCTGTKGSDAVLRDPTGRPLCRDFPLDSRTSRWPRVGRTLTTLRPQWTLSLEEPLSVEPFSFAPAEDLEFPHAFGPSLDVPPLVTFPGFHRHKDYTNSLSKAYRPRLTSSPSHLLDPRLFSPPVYPPGQPSRDPEWVSLHLGTLSGLD